MLFFLWSWGWCDLQRPPFRAHGICLTDGPQILRVTRAAQILQPFAEHRTKPGACPFHLATIAASHPGAPHHSTRFGRGKCN
jgi:hypothetical protein